MIPGIDANAAIPDASRGVQGAPRTFQNQGCRDGLTNGRLCQLESDGLRHKQEHGIKPGQPLGISVRRLGHTQTLESQLEPWTLEVGTVLLGADPTTNETTERAVFRFVKDHIKPRDHRPVAGPDGAPPPAGVAPLESQAAGDRFTHVLAHVRHDRSPAALDPLRVGAMPEVLCVLVRIGMINHLRPCLGQPGHMFLVDVIGGPEPEPNEEVEVGSPTPLRFKLPFSVCRWIPPEEPLTEGVQVPLPCFGRLPPGPFPRVGEGVEQVREGREPGQPTKQIPPGLGRELPDLATGWTWPPFGDQLAGGQVSILDIDKFRRAGGPLVRDTAPDRSGSDFKTVSALKRGLLFHKQIPADLFKILFPVMAIIRIMTGQDRAGATPGWFSYPCCPITN